MILNIKLQKNIWSMGWKAKKKMQFWLYKIRKERLGEISNTRISVIETLNGENICWYSKIARVTQTTLLKSVNKVQFCVPINQSIEDTPFYSKYFFYNNIHDDINDIIGSNYGNVNMHWSQWLDTLFITKAVIQGWNLTSEKM